MRLFGDTIPVKGRKKGARQPFAYGHDPLPLARAICMAATITSGFRNVVLSAGRLISHPRIAVRFATVRFSWPQGRRREAA